MRLLAFADLHLDTPFKWAKANVSNLRRSNLRKSLEKIIELADDLKADAILCAGDLYEHERFSGDTASFLTKCFAKTDLRVFLAPGNHDWHGPESLYAVTEWSKNVHVFTEPGFVPIKLSSTITLWGAAHRAPANTSGFFDSGFAVDGDGINIGLFHGAERSSVPDSGEESQLHAPFNGSQVKASGMDLAVVGHYHKYRREETYIYPGNPDPLTFDAPEGNAVMIEVAETGKITATPHDLSTSEVHDLKIDLTGCDNTTEIRERIQERINDVSGSIRVTLSGDLPSSVSFSLRDDLEGLSDGHDAIVYREKDIRISWDIEAIKQEATVRGTFVRDVHSADLEEDDRQKILTIGLRALDGRKDLEVV
jgi:exonuclease SbcD